MIVLMVNTMPVLDSKNLSGITTTTVLKRLTDRVYSSRLRARFLVSKTGDECFFTMKNMRVLTAQ